jgi:TRAP-type C4-dicarboxylate transport system permease large subunit
VNVLGSVIFAGMSGTAIADAAGLGTIEIKAMTDHGYSKEFSVGVTAASATLGPIIPPSLPFVIYALFANVSVGALFLAGILPGMVMAILMMLTVAFFAHKNKWGADIPFQWPRVLKALGELLIVLLWPTLIWLAVDRFDIEPDADRAAGAGAALRRRLEVQVPGGAADHDAGAPHRRDDHRHLHRHRRRHRRLRVGALPRASCGTAR